MFEITFALLNIIAGILLSQTDKFKDAKPSIKKWIIIALVMLFGSAVCLAISNITFQNKILFSQEEIKQSNDSIKSLTNDLKKSLDSLNILSQRYMESQYLHLRLLKNQSVQVKIPNPFGRIEITSPLEKVFVAPKMSIEGNIEDVKKSVWVIVHPDSSSGYWVQQQASISSNGKWSVPGYFGDERFEDSGKKFEIIAIANPNPNDSIYAGKILNKWPDAEWYSPVIRVKRK